jgi:hypothetical protein
VLHLSDGGHLHLSSVDCRSIDYGALLPLIQMGWTQVQTITVATTVVLVVVAGILVWVLIRRRPEKFDLDLTTNSSLVTPIALGSSPTLTISTDRSKPITGHIRTGLILVLIHSSEFVPSDWFLPTSYASPGLIELASFGSPKLLVKELVGWYGAKAFKTIDSLPGIGLSDGVAMRSIDPGIDHNLVTVVCKVDPSQDLFAVATVNCQLTESSAELMIYSCNASRQQYPANQPRQSSVAYNRISAHTDRGQLVSIGQITVS